jgi:hypothetical protein
MARYRLATHFWDGAQLHPAGAVVELDKAPASAEALDAKPARGKKVAPEPEVAEVAEVPEDALG